MNHKPSLCLAFAIAGLTWASSEPASAVPTISEDLLGVSASVCLRVNDNGDADGAYVLAGSAFGKDEEIVNAVSQYHWDPLPAGDPTRNT